MAGMMSRLRSGLGTLMTGVKRAYGAAEPAVTWTSEKVADQYRKTMKANADYVVRDQEAADKLLRQWFFTRLSRVEHMPERMREEAKALMEKWPVLRKGEMPVTELGMYVGFAAELYAWSVLGEIIGRGSFYRYKVPT